MDYGFAVTDAGRYLIARLLTGETMTITRIMVGSGRIPDDVPVNGMTDLVTPVAQATSSAVTAERGVAHLTVEYRSDLNGGLENGFWLREFGIFAQDPEEGEVLIYYATLGDFPQFVRAYKENTAVDVRRFPVSIAIGEDRNIAVDFHTELWMTAEDVLTFYETDLAPRIGDQIAEAIEEHNADPSAHDSMRKLLNIHVMPRLALSEVSDEMAAAGMDPVGYGHEHILTFDSLDGLTVTGNWNDVLARMEF